MPNAATASSGTYEPQTRIEGDLQQLARGFSGGRPAAPARRHAGGTPARCAGHGDTPIPSTTPSSIAVRFPNGPNANFYGLDAGKTYGGDSFPVLQRRCEAKAATLQVDLRFLQSNQMLQSGHTGAATLDVFEREPLPAGDPPWALPNVFVAPHLASVAAPSSSTEQIAADIRRVSAGTAPENVIDPSRGYRRPALRRGRSASMPAPDRRSRTGSGAGGFNRRPRTPP
ncbi:MAG: NAD(P)-dependent oxidoreductase [Janthinobacterium lividum]